MIGMHHFVPQLRCERRCKLGHAVDGHKIDLAVGLVRERDLSCPPRVARLTVHSICICSALQSVSRKRRQRGPPGWRGVLRWVCNRPLRGARVRTPHRPPPWRVLLPQLDAKLLCQRKHSLVRFTNTPGKVVKQRFALVVTCGLDSTTQGPAALVEHNVLHTTLDELERRVKPRNTTANNDNVVMRYRAVVLAAHASACSIDRRHPGIPFGVGACVQHEETGTCGGHNKRVSPLGLHPRCHPAVRHFIQSEATLNFAPFLFKVRDSI
mmetsp:Transcript_3700/g.9266  ORF Transcript_3700/g.9266 Transcript_3700/m.9266 type:complete len:267 (+) Transcript_3700:128-928(+)